MFAQTLSATLELPALPGLSEFEFRSLRRENVPALYETLLAVERADQRDIVISLEELHHEFDDPWSDAETDALVALTAVGQPIGYARTFQSPQPGDEVRCYINIEVHPDQRVDGLEEALFEWAEARARQRLFMTPGERSRVIRYGIHDTQAQRQTQLDQRGYHVVRYFYRMRRDLSEPIPAVQLPADLALRVYVPDLSEAMHQAFNEAFRDHWSFDPVIDDDWKKFFVGRPSFRPDLTYLVMDGAEITGLSLNSISPGENARRGRSDGWVEELAVRRAWRKRGVATALLCASMHAFKAEGLHYAMLGVDTENPTGALRVYERVGFKPIKRFIQFEKRIES
jgi:mycothiol synthase